MGGDNVELAAWTRRAHNAQHATAHCPFSPAFMPWRGLKYDRQEADKKMFLTSV